jgi:hypothetical protein
MHKISSSARLKNAIQLLEIEQANKRQLLKDQLNFTYESLKPLNLLRKALKDITTSPGMMENILGSVLGLASGYASKKIFLGTSGNIIRKLLGTVLQFGVTNAVAQHPDAVKSVVQSIIQHLFHKKEINSENRAS